MDVPLRHKATDCRMRPRDWATIGGAILEAATIATAMHLGEQARRTAIAAGQVGGERQPDESRHA